jgi:death-on-curing protein
VARADGNRINRIERKDHRENEFCARFAIFAEKLWTGMNEPCWISREECLVLHEMMLLRYGGVAGVRDSAVLDAALARPKERFAAGVAGLPELAASYAVGIARNRPFASGNLGTAVIVASTFLGVNGLLFTGKELPLVETVLNLAQGQESEAEFAHYLRCNCDPIEADR